MENFDFKIRMSPEKQPSAYLSLLVENLSYSVIIEMQLAELKALLQNKLGDAEQYLDTYEELRKKTFEELKANVLSRFGE